MYRESKRTMSVLGKLTDEYFGKTIREEELMRPPKKAPKYPTRDLTREEMVFLSALAKHIMFLDKSLFFQIDNLRKHTELVLSGETETVYRHEFPDPDELNKEIEELEKMIEELEQMIKDLDPQKDWDLIERLKDVLKSLKEQLKELQDALKKGRHVEKTTMLLGEYRHNNGYDSEVILYVNNIEKRAGYDPVKTMYLMGQVLLHEFFHSFYYHVGLGTQLAFGCAEEPMAEYGSLVALDSVASSGSPIATLANNARIYTYDIVKSKQSCKGLTAAYGFGAYLFDKHKDDCRELIAEYANVSRLLNEHGKAALMYKYMVYPKYPSSSRNEAIAYDKLRELMRPWKVTIKSGSSRISMGKTSIVSHTSTIVSKGSMTFDFERNIGVFSSKDHRIHSSVPKNVMKSKSLGKGSSFIITFYDKKGVFMFSAPVKIWRQNGFGLPTDIQNQFIKLFGHKKIPFGFYEKSAGDWEAHEL